MSADVVFRCTHVRPHKPGLEKFMGELEAKLMVAVWGGCRTISTIQREINDLYGSYLAYTTIQTIAQRLVKKSMLRAEKRAGEATIFNPQFPSEDAFIKVALQEILFNLSIDYGPDVDNAFQYLKNHLQHFFKE
jgi:predicted transcriptional regulator